MATKKAATDGKKTPSQEERPENPDKAFARSTAFSTRLTPEQRALIEEAAQLKGWTASKLIRIASVDRAANIVNMREDEPGLLGSFATRVGRQLVDTRLDYFDEHGKPVPRHLPRPDDEFTPAPSEMLELEIYGENHDRKAKRELILFDEGGFDGDPEADDDGARSVVPECFSRDDLVLLRDAIRLGGAEFMGMVIEWCERFKAGRVQRLADREYIDPTSMETRTLSALPSPEHKKSPDSDLREEVEGAMEDLEEEEEGYMTPILELPGPWLIPSQTNTEEFIKPAEVVGIDASGGIHVLDPKYKDLYAVSERKVKDGVIEERCMVSVGPDGATEEIEVTIYKILTEEEGDRVEKRLIAAEKIVRDLEDAHTLDQYRIPRVSAAATAYLQEARSTKN